MSRSGLTTLSPPFRAITGSTRLYAVLGDPVRQVRAPALLNPLFARLGLDAVLVPVQVTGDRLAEVVRGLRQIGNLDGFLITVPHKIEVCRLVERVSPAVMLSGSANAIRREGDGTWYAENFDGAGFVAGLAAVGIDVVGQHVALVGAGGAGGAIAAAVLGAGAGRLSVCDQDQNRLDSLLARLGPQWPGRIEGTRQPALDGVDLAVNATALGLNPGDPLAFDPAGLPPGAVVADIIMQPGRTALLRAAEATGHRTHPGEHMLDHQVDLYRAFFGLEPATG